MEGTPVSLPQGQIVEGAMSGGITVQIISNSSAVQAAQTGNRTTVTSLNKVEDPGVAEALLNIAQPEGYITPDQVHVVAFSKVSPKGI